jgi:hypothetical protein
VIEEFPVGFVKTFAPSEYIIMLTNPTIKVSGNPTRTKIREAIAFYVENIKPVTV